MLYIILSFLLVAGITLWQALQGIFSSIIMLVLTILAAAVAVNYYGPLSQSMMLEHFGDCADAVALGGLFLLVLIGLRFLTDFAIRGNITTWPWPDRIGGGVVGFFTAMILVGLSSISLEMLPFDAQFLLFERFDSNRTRRGIFPYADEFAASVLSGVNKGVLSPLGGKLKPNPQFTMLHPDWPAEVSAQRIAIQVESKHAVAPGTMKVIKAWWLNSSLLKKGFELSGFYRTGSLKVTVGKEKVRPKDGHKFFAVRMELQKSAADSDNYHRFSWGQVRLVGFTGADRKHPRNYWMVGFQDIDVPGEYNYVMTDVPLPEDWQDEDNLKRGGDPVTRRYGVVAPADNNSFDVVFEVPDEFSPWFLEYKRWARATVPGIIKAGDTTATHAPGGAADAPKPRPDRRTARRGAHVQHQIDYDGTAFTAELPFKLTTTIGSRRVNTAEGTIELVRMQYASGAVTGWTGRDAVEDLDSKTGGKVVTVQQFAVPQGKAMLRVECHFVRAETRLLQNVFGAVQRITPKYVYDKQGNAHTPVGQYIIIKDSQGDRIEIDYDPESLGTGHAKPFKTRLNGVSGKDIRVGFLYLIDKGASLDRFEMGQMFEAQSLEHLTAQ